VVRDDDADQRQLVGQSGGTTGHESVERPKSVQMPAVI
jgi:hypothetical protein